ncbi:MAG: hypothetical protein UT55_C0011G0007 [Candidatus Peregrinibacteria bacterium GW2011_GWE2_39_6]|nr:MAG: hypothetical protein UT36_C0004G0036 [Candidatus Peregrinibacteria bacterium GW2011_GWF2_39_17]KKR26302.1 MAG: hypothetical protein UT55_C0011G0007 [Candidatus Peregrinibacteria bacterium GW2011_GWE2_39_6]HCW32678.1 hypothetical protein [Candidatus Peregrinibacteria bacterium]
MISAKTNSLEIPPNEPNLPIKKLNEWLNAHPGTIPFLVNHPNAGLWVVRISYCNGITTFLATPDNPATTREGDGAVFLQFGPDGHLSQNYPAPSLEEAICFIHESEPVQENPLGYFKIWLQNLLGNIPKETSESF